MTESVKLDWRNIERFHQSLIIGAICARFNGLSVVRYDIEVGIDYFHQWLDKRESFRTERYFTHGIGSLGVIDYQFGVFLFAVDNIYSFDSTLHLESSVLNVYVLPA